MTKRRLILWISVICLLVVLMSGTALAATTGWVENSDGTWSYYINEYSRYRSGVYKIGNAYYGFDDSGVMYDNEEFYADVYDKDGQWLDWGCFRAKKGGQLIVNQWCQRGSEWFYYGANGKGADDFLKIGKNWYFFESGRMVTNQLVYSYLYEGYYIIGANGTDYKLAPTTGWVNVAGDYYYIKDGQQCAGGVFKIGNAYYGFDWDGRMYDNTAFEMDAYDEDGDWLGWKQYCAKKGGQLLVNAWHQEGDEWYYYGAEGVAPRGYTKIGSAAYYFYYAGRMATSTYEYVDGVYYAFGADGKQITKAGKQDIGRYYVYVNADGSLVMDDWVKIGANWHYFWPEMVANTVTELDGALYAVNNAGVCTAVTGNGIYDIGIYGKVYIENGKIAENTWKKVDGAWYYFSYSMCKNGVYDIDDELYVFDQNGKLYTGGWLLLGESNYKGYYENSLRYYVYAGPAGKAFTGLKTIGGKQYVFDDWGMLYVDTSVTIQGVTYVVDKDGAVTATFSKNGWHKVGTKYYYVSNGWLVRDEVMTIGGKMYAFNYEGVMVTNQTYWGDDGYILAKADGTLVVNGWYQFNGEWYYADADGCLVDGRNTIGGKTYIFDYFVMRTGTFMWDGMIITTNASGAVVSELDPAEGWSYVDGTVMYYKDGQPYNGWVGDYLIRYGEMSINDYWSWEGDWYAFDTYGKYVKSGWHQFDYGFGKGDYVYAKAGGKLCYDEWLQIGSKWYYFEGVWMLSDGTYYVDGQLCRFDANGVYLGNGTAVSGSDGWKQSGSNWYYIHAGEPVTGVQWIGGKRYVFDWDGILAKGGFFYTEDSWFYTDTNGAIPNYTGWKKLNGEWCFFDSSNMPVLGWFQDGGKEYHAEVKLKKGVEVIGLTTGYLYNNGQLFYFDGNGVCKGTKGVQNGWFQGGSEWYYFVDGYALSGEACIGGKWYYFSDGKMMTDVIIRGRYYGSSGVARTTVGWSQVDKKWIYVMDGTGRLADGVQKIGGKEYYFNNCVMVR